MKNKKDFPKDYVTIYSDAGFKDGKGTWAVWCRADHGRLVLHGKCPDEIVSITAAEAYAISIGVKNALHKWPQTKGFYIKTDSKDAIKALVNSKFGVKHKELMERLKIAFDKLVEGRELKLKFSWVKGHQKNQTMQAWLNNKVDSLTKQARL